MRAVLAACRSGLPPLAVRCGCRATPGAACDSKPPLARMRFRLQWGGEGGEGWRSRGGERCRAGIPDLGRSGGFGIGAGPFGAADRRSSRGSLRPSIWMEGRRRGRPGKAARAAAGKKRLLRFRLRAQSSPRCFARMLEGSFRNAPSGTQRGPCSARALPRARCGSVPRTNVSRETFSASKAEGGGIARAKRARGRGKARLPMCVQMFHVKHPVQVGRDAMVQAGRNAVVRLQAS